MKVSFCTIRQTEVCCLMSDLSDEVLFNNCKISIFQCDFADSLNSFVVSLICQYIEMGKYMKQSKILLFQCLLS